MPGVQTTTAPAMARAQHTWSRLEISFLTLKAAFFMNSCCLVCAGRGLKAELTPADLGQVLGWFSALRIPSAAAQSLEPPTAVVTQPD